MPYDALIESLELLADRDLDPGEAVYARLFAEHPEARDLFVRDADGAVRGAMMAQAIESLLDLSGPRLWGHNLIAAERINHEGLGVPPTLFVSFWGMLRDVCRELLGEAWTEARAADWDAALDELERLCRPTAAAEPSASLAVSVQDDIG